MKNKIKQSELRERTVKFVTEVITEVYGQKADRRTVNETADRVLAGIPRSDAKQHHRESKK